MVPSVYARNAGRRSLKSGFAPGLWPPFASIVNMNKRSRKEGEDTASQGSRPRYGSTCSGRSLRFLRPEGLNSRAHFLKRDINRVLQTSKRWYCSGYLSLNRLPNRFITSLSLERSNSPHPMRNNPWRKGRNNPMNPSPMQIQPAVSITIRFILPIHL